MFEQHPITDHRLTRSRCRFIPQPRFSRLWLMLCLYAVLTPHATSLEVKEPIILATTTEYKELVDALDENLYDTTDCDSPLLNTLNHHLDGRVQLRYYPGRRIALAGEAGRVQGIYYSPKPQGLPQIPNMVAIEGSLIKEATLFFSDKPIGELSQYQNRPIAYLSAYRRIAKQVSNGFYGSSSVQAQSIQQMIKLLAAGRIDGFFVISSYQKLATKLYQQATQKPLHSQVVHDDIELYLHIHEHYPELIEELEIKYQHIQKDPLFNDKRLNIDNC